MAGDLTEPDVIAAFRMLFPLDMKVNGSLLESLQPSDVTGAYRRRALETHPDRFFGADERFRSICSQRFIAVREAYTTLSAYLRIRQEKVFRFPEDSRPESAHFRKKEPSGRHHPKTDSPSRPAPGEGFSSAYWQMGPPQRSLRLAEFLYYSGVVPWSVWIEGIVWQRKQRPRVGEIAQRWRWLTEAQIRMFLRNRWRGERFGETLLRHHIINPFQLRVLLSHQQKAQRPIGGFFVDNGFLTEDDIRRHLERQRSHNLRFEKGTRPP